jgi:UTP--glucose-1-phosphate uridylyltransferase
MPTLAEELDSLPQDLRARLERAGFDRARLLRLAGALAAPDAAAKRADENRVKGPVRGPSDDEILAIDPTDSARLAKIGHDAIVRGELAFCVMAGGMATRMGGVVKALVEAFGGHTFLSLRLGENRTVSARPGQTKPVPLWLMTSEATDHGIRDALAKANAPAHVRCFMQDLSLRLTKDGHLFRGKDGQPSTYATGHGDLVDALRRSGLLQPFVAGGGKYVWIANLDNLGAAIDDAILGRFIESGKDVMVEVCEKVAGDRGGIPVHANGKLQVLEEFRLPTDFDAQTVRVFNTNTFLVRAQALAEAPIDWTFFYVEKKVDGEVAVQFERLLQELTAALPSTYIKIPREGDAARFLPVKDMEELAARRAVIERVARARGMV